MIYVIDRPDCLIACREFMADATTVLPDDATHYRDLPLIDLADTVLLDSPHVLVCATVAEFEMVD